MNWRDHLKHNERGDLAVAEAAAAAGVAAYQDIRKIRQRCLQRQNRAVKASQPQ